MKTSRSPRSERSSSRLKTRLLSATALAAAGGLLAQPAAAGGVYRYDASIPYSDNVVVDTVMTTIYAINGVEAAFAGTVTYQAGGSGILHIGDFPQPDGTILFAPTSIVSQIGNPVLHLNGGTLKLGNAIARNFLANTAELELTGGTLDLNGGNLSVQRLSSPHGSTRITNNAAGTNAILTIQATGSRDVSSAIVNGAGGAGGLGVHIEGSGSVRLAGDNGYTNGTRLVSSNLQLAHSNALGTGTLAIEGLGSNIVFGNGINIGNGVVLHDATVALEVAATQAASLNGPISGDGDIFKVGAGELEFRGEHTAGGRIFVNAGTLTTSPSNGEGFSDTASVIISQNATFRVMGHETIRDVAGLGTVRLEDESQLTLGGASDSTFSGLVVGEGVLRKEGEGALRLNGRNTYSGDTLLSQGALVAGVTDALGTGHIRVGNDTRLVLRDGVRLNNGIMLEGHDVNVQIGDDETGTLGGRIWERAPAAGDLGLRKLGNGTLVLIAADSAVAFANVEGGTLRIDGRLAAPVSVFADGKLTGTGTVQGDVVVQDGGMLQGRSGEKLAVTGNLTLNRSSYLDVRLGAASNSALFDIGGNLTLDGRLTIADAGGFGRGVYRLFDYGGTLTDNGLDVTGAPGGIPLDEISVQTAIARQVNIVVGAGPGPGEIPEVQFWDGAATTANGRIDGGSGTWAPASTNWTRTNGQANDSWGGRFAVFQGQSGTVTVDGGGQPVLVGGMQFASMGYRVEGGPLTLQGADGQTVIRVGNGNGASANMVATIASVLAGASRLVKSDFGTLILEGSNSYTGGTEIRSGTLQVSRDANLGAASGGLFLNGGTLATTASFDIARAVALTGTGRIAVAADTELGFSGVVAGGGDLIKAGTGTLRLGNAANGYRNTLVEAGTLIGQAGSISGTIGNAGTVVFEQNTDASFGGDIVGLGGARGTMVKRGGGELTLNGRSALDWTIEAGGLATAAERFEGNAAIAAKASLTFNQAADAAYAGVLAGQGQFRKTGSALLKLTGDSGGFAGATSVEDGTLAVDGKLGGTLDIGTAGRLQGTGALADTTVRGTIAPGNSIGTLRFDGNIVFQPGSIYEVELSATGQADKVEATGTAAVNGGSVRVLAGMGDYAPSTRYTILSAAGGRTGAFGSVTSNLAFLDPVLSYDINNVYLTMTRNSTGFATIGATRNQVATGGGVESLRYGNPVYNAVLGLSRDQARQAFDQLSGEVHVSARSALVEDSRFLRSAVNDRIRAAFGDVGAPGESVVTYEGGQPRAVSARTDRLAVWGQGFGAWGDTAGDGNAARLDRSTGGFFIGADAPVFDAWRFGAVAGYSRTSFDVKGRHSSGSSDNYHLGLYGGAKWGNLSLRTGAAYSWHDVSTSRSVTFPGFGGHMAGGYDAATAQLFGELGYGVGLGAARFEPFLNLAYVNVHSDGFTEQGGAAALHGASASTGVTFATLGLRAATTFELKGIAVAAKGMLGWRHAFAEVTPLTAMRFATGGDAFGVGGVPVARDAAVVEAGLDFALSPAATLGIIYAGQFGSGVTDQSFKANFNARF